MKVSTQGVEALEVTKNRAIVAIQAQTSLVEVGRSTNAVHLLHKATHDVVQKSVVMVEATARSTAL